MISKGLFKNKDSRNIIIHLRYSSISMKKLISKEENCIYPEFTITKKGLLLKYNIDKYIVIGNKYQKNGIYYTLYIPKRD